MSTAKAEVTEAERAKVLIHLRAAGISETKWTSIDANMLAHRLGIPYRRFLCILGRLIEEGVIERSRPNPYNFSRYRLLQRQSDQAKQASDV